MLDKLIFDKSLDQISLFDIQKYFAVEQTESDKIEFKSYINYPGDGNGSKNSKDREKVRSILETLAAFLNSDGGLLIWGAPVGTLLPDSKEKVFVGELTPVDYSIEPDQFNSMVADLISPTPIRIGFKRIEFENGKYIYVFEAVKSEFAPHQIRGTYFMRVGASTRPAPHHYVEGLIKKITYPKLDARLTFGRIKDFGLQSAGIALVLTIHNQSPLINERNVQYRIVGVNADLLKMTETSIPQLKNNFDIIEKTQPVLHCRIPFYQEFLLLTKGCFAGSQAYRANIMLTVWGDQSPAITSQYELDFSHKGMSTVYSISAKENVYLIENAGIGNLSHDIATSNSMLIEIVEKKMNSLPLFQTLNR